MKFKESIRPLFDFWKELPSDYRQRVVIAGWLALFFTALTLAIMPRTLVGDETRYLWYAENLTKGYYVSDDRPDFCNGPGYPVVMMPFVVVDAPIWTLRLLNVAFQVGAFLLFLDLLTRLGLRRRWCYMGSLALVLNPILLRYSGQLCTEMLAVFLCTGFLWSLEKGLRDRSYSWKWLVIAGVWFFGLTMVRVLFGYVATALLVMLALLWIAKRAWAPRPLVQAMAVPLALTLLLSVPWLSYTFAHTGKVFCWSTNGSELLYWISGTEEGHLGSWLGPEDLEGRPGAAENHREFIMAIEELPFSEQADVWTAAALENIRSDPRALARNLAANVSRILFSFPRSYYLENLKTLLWVVPGMIATGLGLLAIYPSLRGWRQLPAVAKFGLAVFAVFFGGSVLLPAEPRFLLPVTPVLALWITYVFARWVRIQWFVEEKGTLESVKGRAEECSSTGVQMISLESPSKAA